MPEPWLRDPDVTLLHGDVLDCLRELPDESVDCAATSPPFFGLRDYGTGRWEGGDENCEHRVREKPSIATSTLGGGKGTVSHQQQGFREECPRCGAHRIDQQIGLEATPEEWRDRLVEVFREVRRVLVPTGTLWVECGDSYSGHNERGFRPGNEAKNGGVSNKNGVGFVAGTKPKDLIGAPFLLAFGLRADGWYWRSTNIWAKPNCLPEPVTDRPVVQHSYVFQFSRKARYYHDAEAVREPAEWARWGDQTVVKEQQGKGAWIGPRPAAELRSGRVGRYQERAMYGNGDGTTPRKTLDEPDPSRSLRSVWTIPTQGYPEAHFATWPEKLAERILLMACPPGGCVLDPFVGSGTTLYVARKLGRRGIGIDLNADYLELAARRLQQQSLFATEGAA